MAIYTIESESRLVCQGHGRNSTDPGCNGCYVSGLVLDRGLGRCGWPMLVYWYGYNADIWMSFVNKT